MVYLLSRNLAAENIGGQKLGGQKPLAARNRQLRFRTPLLVFFLEHPQFPSFSGQELLADLVISNYGRFPVRQSFWKQGISLFIL